MESWCLLRLLFLACRKGTGDDVRVWDSPRDSVDYSDYSLIRSLDVPRISTHLIFNMHVYANSDDFRQEQGHVYRWQQRSMRLAASFSGSGGPWMCRSSAFICLQPIVCRGRLPRTLFRMAAHMDADLLILLVQSGRNCLRQNLSKSQTRMLTPANRLPPPAVAT